MKGTYKIYDRDAKAWVELPLYFKGDSVKLKIENSHLYASYDEEKTWEDVGEINTGVDKAYVDENFAKKDEVVINKSDDGGTTILDDEGVTIASGNEEQMIGYLGVSNSNSALISMKNDDEIVFTSMVGVGVETAMLMSDSQDEYEDSYNSSGILASPNQISLQHTNDDTTNTVTLDDDGLKYNNSPVITSENIDSLNIIKVDENGIANKNEITIGAFEIKNDKPYNYTLEGRFYPYDPECAEGFNVIAHYDQKGVKYGDIIDGSQGFGPIEDWYYGFVITDISFDDLELGDERKNKTLDRFLNRNIPVLAAYIDDEYTVDGVDTVTFADDVSEELSILYTEDNHIDDVTFTRSTPFSLKHTSKALLNGVEIATLDDIQNITVDTKLDINSNNPIANSAVANAIKGGVHFIGTTSQLPWEGLQNTTIGQSLTGGSTQEYGVGDIIIVASGGNEQGLSEPTKEYILVYGNESEENGDVIHGYRWVELGDISPAQGMIDKSLENYYKKSEVYNKSEIDTKIENIDIPSTNSPIVKGDVNNSAVLNGEYTVSGTKYKNKAISQVSMSAGAASTAGLKGWYYTKVNLSTNQIWLSDTRLTNKIPIIGTVIGLKIETTTSTTPDSTSFNSGWKVGDEVTIVNDKKYDRCAKITAINGNMIKLDKLPFDSETIVESAASIGDYNEPDEFSITAVRITDNDTLKTRSVSSYDKGNVDFGGGAYAEGVQTYALNIGAHAEGIQTVAHGQYSHTEGFRTEAAYAAHAEGRSCKAIGQQSHAEGENSEAHGHNSHVEGKNSKTLAKFSHAEGNTTTAKGEASHTEGYKTISANNTSHAEGSQTVAYGGNAHAEGQGGSYDAEIYNKTKEEIVALWDAEMKINCALGRSCHTEGLNTLASGDYSHAEGQHTKAAGSDSHAEGSKTKALENNAHAEGVSTVASGNAAHAEGNTTTSSGKASHAEGIETNSSNEASHAEGYKTEASGLYAHAEGNETKATGKYSHTEGYKTESTNNNAHAEGNQTKAFGNSAHAEGKLTIASKDFSHAGGLSSTAEGIGSFAHGNYATATKDYEIALGKFNASNNNTIFSVGNGDETTRKNAFEITDDGRIYIYKKDGTRVCLQELLNIW